MFGRDCLVALCAACVVMSSSWSAAEAQQSSDEQARLHYQVAASYFEQADYESALREFQSAYRLSQRAQLFYNISLCYQQLDDYDAAITYLERYLGEVTEIDNRPSLEQRLTNLRARREERNAAAQLTASEVTPPVAETRPSGDPLNVPAIVGFSIAGLGLIAGAIFTGLLFAEDSDVSALECARARTCGPSDVSSLDTFALVSDIGWGVSLAGAIVGTIFLFVPTGSSASSTDASASLRLVPHLGQTSGLTLEGRF